MADDAPNAQQAAYWTEIGGPHWVEQQRLFDHALINYGAEALRVLDARSGERVLDIGCGTATTSMAIADIVGQSGRVHGCDISPTMIDAARLRAASYPQVSFAIADVQTDSLTTDDVPSFDAAYSRFGVMFFADPKRAFANIASAMRSGGRLVFVCWRAEELNPWMDGPAQVMRRFTPEPVLPAPNEPGPFAFSDDDRVTRLLSEAGWIDIDLTPFAAETVLGGGNGLDEALSQTLKTRAGLAMREQVDDATYAEATEAVREILAAHMVDGAVVFNGNVWITTARKP